MFCVTHTLSFSFGILYEQASTIGGRGHIISGSLLLIAWETLLSLDTVIPFVFLTFYNLLHLIWHEFHLL